MDFNDSEFSQPRGLTFIVLDSQEESESGVQGETTGLPHFPALQMDQSNVKMEVDLSKEQPAEEVSGEGDIMDEYKVRATDTDSEMDIHLQPCSQKPSTVIPETNSESDSGLHSNLPLPPLHQTHNISSSSDEVDKTLKAVCISSSEELTPGNTGIKPTHSISSSEKYKLGSGAKVELSHTQSPHLTYKMSGKQATEKSAYNVPSPKDLFGLSDSESDEVDGKVVPSSQSGGAVYQMDSLDCHSVGDVPPSMEAYGSSPVVIPSSPSPQESMMAPEQEVEVYNPEELSTLESKGRQQRQKKGAHYGSSADSKSDSSSKSNGDTRESFKAWQPVDMLSYGESFTDLPTGSARDQTTGQHSSRISSGQPEMPEKNLSEERTEDSDSLKLKFSTSHTEEDRSDSTKRSKESSPDQGDKLGLIDSQYVALHLSPSQPDSTHPDSEYSENQPKAVSQPDGQTERLGIGSSDPIPGKAKVKSIDEGIPYTGAVDSTPDKPLSSTPDDYLTSEKPTVKPSLSLSMIDMQDDEEDSSVQFKLTRPSVPFHGEVPLDESENLFKKGVSPQKRRKPPVLEDSYSETSTEPHNSRQLLEKFDKPTKQHSQKTSKGKKSAHEETVKPAEKSLDDPDITLPLEDTRHGDIETENVEEKGLQRQTSLTNALEESQNEDSTVLYNVDSYPSQKEHMAKEANITEHEGFIQDTLKESPSNRQSPVTRTQDPYQFIDSQALSAPTEVTEAIKNPNKTPVTMPKSRSRTAALKKKRKKAVTIGRTTRARTTDKGGKPGTTSSESDQKHEPENSVFPTHPSIIKKSKACNLKELPVQKTVRLSMAPKEDPSVQPSADLSIHNTQTLNMSATAGGGSQSVVRWKKVVTTKTQVLYEHRHITIEERKDGKILSRHVTEEKEDPVVLKTSVTTTTHEEKEMLSPGPSPSRSVSTVTSGDLGDVSSSLSRSSSHGSKTSSGWSLDPMHSSLDRTASLGTLSSRDDGHLPTKISSIHSESPIGQAPHPDQPMTSGLTKGMVTTHVSMVTGSDVLFTSSDWEKSDRGKVPSKDLNTSHMELSPIVIEHQTPPVHVTEKHAADSSDENRISGGKTQTVVVSPEISSSSSFNLQTSGGFNVQEKSVITPRSSRKNTGKTSKTGRKSRIISKEPSSDEISLAKKRKVSKQATQVPEASTSSKKNNSGNSDDISPEIPVQAPESSVPGAVTTDYSLLTHENVTALKGAFVMAKWKDGYFYPGQLRDLKSNDKCMVHFADGDHLAVRLVNIIVTERLSIGQSVLVESHDGGFDPGLVIGYSGQGLTLKYSIERDDSATVNYPRNKVILSGDQAALILGDEDIPLTPLPAHNTSAADVSLDNLVEGKRRTRRDAVSELRGAPTTEKKGTSRKGKGKRPAVKGPSQTDLTTTRSTDIKSTESTGSPARKRKAPVFEPSETSTPTPKQTRRAPQLGEVTPARSDLGGVIESPVTVRRGRKAKVGLFDTAKGPLPSDPRLFEGLTFLLTHVDKTDEQRQAEKRLLQESSFEGSTDESAIEEEVVVPFDKEHLKAQIQAGGGKLLNHFDPAQIGNTDQVYLISDCYQRTVKYFQCLAARILCVSHVWIRDSSKQGKLLDAKAYVLPAGVNIDTGRVMECSRRHPLVGVAVNVVCLSQEFKDAWMSILATAGCEVTSQLSTNPTVDPDLGIVVADNTCPKSFIVESQSVGVAVVSTEWVIQCLIRGEYLEPSSHPRYHPHFS